MKQFINEFIPFVHKNLETKFNYLWPTKQNIFPHENNIALAIAEEASKKGCFTYAECNMNSKGARRDLILVNPFEKWICQIELKFQQTWENYESDFWRVSLYEDLSKFINSEDRKSVNLSEFQLYGLFIAGGREPLYNLWKKPLEPHNWLENWFNDFPEGKIVKGVYPEEIFDKKFILSYYLIEVTEENTEEWINNR